MKRLATLTMVLAAGALGVGCGPIETKIDADPVQITVPGEGVLGGNPLSPDVAFPADAISAAIAQSVNQSIDTSGYDKSRVSSLKLTSLTLEVTNPDDPPGAPPPLNSLAFLQSLAIFFGPEESRVKAAESGQGDFESRPIEYEMPLTNAELADVFKASDQFDMSADVEINEPQTTSSEVEVRSQITVQIAVF